MASIVFIIIVSYIIIKRQSVVQSENARKVDELFKEREDSAPLTQDEQEELKDRIRSRMKSSPDPKRMPKEYREWAPEEVSAFHDVMDECGDDGCDVSPTPSDSQTNASSGDEGKARIRKLKRNAVVQMMIADSVLNTKYF